MCTRRLRLDSCPWLLLLLWTNCRERKVKMVVIWMLWVWVGLVYGVGKTDSEIRNKIFNGPLICQNPVPRYGRSIGCPEKVHHMTNGGWTEVQVMFPNDRLVKVKNQLDLSRKYCTCRYCSALILSHEVCQSLGLVTTSSVKWLIPEN